MDRIQGYARVGSYDKLEKETLIKLLNERDERIEFLLSEVKRYKDALTKITEQEVDIRDPDVKYLLKIADEALKDQ